MRYTTLIDISELREVYRNKNARLVYLHLALKCGYHDSDRDLTGISIRAIEAETGVSLSAVRNALRVLSKAGLLERREDGRWQVKKWLIDEPPTPRPRKKQAAAVKAEGKIGERYEQEIKEYQQQVLSAVRQCGRDELAAWVQELEENRSIKHHGVYISANQQNINWLKTVLSKI